MNVATMVQKLSKRLDVPEAEVRRFYTALVEEMKLAMAHLDEVRFPSFGKLAPRLAPRSGGRRLPQQPECALCQNGTRATPRHVVTAHKMTYKAYCDEYGGPTWVESDNEDQIYITFKLYRGARDRLMQLGPLPQLMEEARESSD